MRPLPFPLDLTLGFGVLISFGMFLEELCRVLACQ